MSHILLRTVFRRFLPNSGGNMKLQNIVTICLCLALLAIGCSDDSTSPTNSTTPDQSGDSFIDIRGITWTATSGEVIENDPDDWCLPSGDKNDPPIEFALYPAYPNPSNQQVVLKYDVPVSAIVNFSIIDSTGDVVRNLLQDSLEAGHYSTVWDRKDDSGLYIESGIFRLIMTSEEFECYGDIRLNLVPNDLTPVRLTATVSGNSMVIRYNSEGELGALYFLLTYTGQVNNIFFHNATKDMQVTTVEAGGDVRVLIIPELSDSSPMPALPAGDQKLCTIYFDGSIALTYADATDAGTNTQSIIKTEIVNVVVE